MNKILIVKDAAEKALIAENVRTESLLRAEAKLAAGTIVVAGFQLMDANNVLGPSSHWTDILYYLSLAGLSAALFLAFRGMQAKGYAGYPRGKKLWDTLKPENISEDAAQEALVQMLLETREQNARLNDSKVKSLSWCGWLLFAGFLLVVASQLLNPILNSLATS